MIVGGICKAAAKTIRFRHDKLLAGAKACPRMCRRPDVPRTRLRLASLPFHHDTRFCNLASSRVGIAARWSSDSVEMMPAESICRWQQRLVTEHLSSDYPRD